MSMPGCLTQTYQDTCSVCDTNNGWQLNDGQCQNCQEIAPGCKTCDYETKECTSCTQGNLIENEC